MTITKIITLFTSLFLFWGLIACNDNSSSSTPIETQETITKNNVGEPEVLNYKTIKASELKTGPQVPVATVSSKQPEEEGDAPVMYTDFYPLGWSENGLFASLKHSMTYHEGDEMVYTIQDMTSNKVLWTHTTIIAFCEEEDYSGEADPDVVLRVNNKAEIKNKIQLLSAVSEEKVLEALKKHSIVYHPSGSMLNQVNYKEMTFEVTMKEGDDKENSFEYHLNNNKGKSVLLEKHYQEAHATNVVGIIKSPYDAELFAVVCEQRRQFFEMTDEVVPFVAGFNL